MKRLTTLACCALVLSGCALKQHDLSIYNNKQNLAAKLTKDNDGWTVYSDGSKYRGQFDGALAQGQGELIKPDGTQFKGDFKQGKPSGNTIAVFANGDRYQGKYINGAPNGKGTYRHLNGQVREGTFKAGILIDGLLIKADGNRYRGSFKNEQLNANTATHTTPEGTTFKGKFSEGVKSGVFVTALSNGSDRYQIWDEDSLAFEFPGPNTIRNASAQTCMNAHWVKLSGTCTANSQSLSIYDRNTQSIIQGSFSKGILRQGSQFNISELTLKHGDWNNNTLEGNGAEYNKGYLTYEGGFYQGKRHGLGVCILSNQPVECEYYQGARTDSAYLREKLNKDLAAISRTHQSEIKKIQKATANKKYQFEQQYKSKLRGYENDIERANKIAFTQSMLQGTSALANGASDSQARAIMQQQLDKVERLRQQIAREKESYARTQGTREKRWFDEQQVKLNKVKLEFDKRKQDVIKKHQISCNAIPTKTWNATSQLCESRV